MKFVFALGLFTMNLWAQPVPETFIVQINDRSLVILSPEKRRNPFTVVVENRSLSEQLGKFTIAGKLLKYVTVKPGTSEAVEIENKTSSTVFFVPVSPAFQEAELIFGKKAYEIPPKK